MSAVVSKNLYELLGNTHDEDSDQEPEPPVKTVEKHVMRTSKRNAPEEPPIKNSSGSGGKGGKRGLSGNEGAYYDRNAGSANNRGKPTDVDERGKAYGQNDNRGRGVRGGPRNFDRHSRGGVRDSERQVKAGWGSNEGGAELSDELAAEALAKSDKEAAANWGANDGSGTNNGSGATEGWGEAETKAEPVPEVEPEEVTISYADYLLQQQEKKAALAVQPPQIRQPNEGVIHDRRWANAKPIIREENEDFFQGAGGKVKRERERRQKQVIEIDQGYVESPDRGNRGGGFQGSRGSRGGRGARGDGYQRGGRGGGVGGGEKRSPEPSTSINTDDISAFPNLGS